MAENTILVYGTDNGAETFTWPDGGMIPFRGFKGTTWEGGFRAPAMIRWPGKVPAGKVENGLISGLDWFPTLVAAAGNPNIKEQLLKGVELNGRKYKNYIDGYNQLDYLTGKVKEQWGKLTDDDLDVIAGRRDQLAGKIQERDGVAKDEAELQETMAEVNKADASSGTTKLGALLREQMGKGE